MGHWELLREWGRGNSYITQEYSLRFVRKIKKNRNGGSMELALDFNIDN
jgi:hypothetical protein